MPDLENVKDAKDAKDVEKVTKEDFDDVKKVSDEPVDPADNEEFLAVAERIHRIWEGKSTEESEREAARILLQLKKLQEVNIPKYYGKLIEYYGIEEPDYMESIIKGYITYKEQRANVPEEKLEAYDRLWWDGTEPKPDDVIAAARTCLAAHKASILNIRVENEKEALYKRRSAVKAAYREKYRNDPDYDLLKCGFVILNSSNPEELLDIPPKELTAHLKQEANSLK